MCPKQSVSKRLHYVWTTFFPPNARFVLLCHYMTPPYSARRRLPCSHHERTRLTSTTINRAILVRCKNTKKLLIKSLFVWKYFIKTLNLTDFDLFFAVISTVLRMETHSYRCKKAKDRCECHTCQYSSPSFSRRRSLMSGFFQNDLLLCRMT